MHSGTWLPHTFSAAASLVAAGLLFSSSLAAETMAVEEIVAKVNGEIITRGEVDKQRLMFEAELRQQGLMGHTLLDATNKKKWRMTCAIGSTSCFWFRRART